MLFRVRWQTGEGLKDPLMVPVAGGLRVGRNTETGFRVWM